MLFLPKIVVHFINSHPCPQHDGLISKIEEQHCQIQECKEDVREKEDRLDRQREVSMGVPVTLRDPQGLPWVICGLLRGL